MKTKLNVKNTAAKRPAVKDNTGLVAQLVADMEARLNTAIAAERITTQQELTAAREVVIATKAELEAMKTIIASMPAQVAIAAPVNQGFSWPKFFEQLGLMAGAGLIATIGKDIGYAGGKWAYTEVKGLISGPKQHMALTEIAGKKR